MIEDVLSGSVSGSLARARGNRRTDLQREFPLPILIKEEARASSHFLWTRCSAALVDTIATMAFSALLDACVLYPVGVRDLLLSVAEREVYVPHWTAEILDEMERNVVAEGRATAERMAAMRHQMNIAFPFAQVEDYQALTAAMTNDPKDRHVLAAAVRARIGLIVTENVSDFPSSSCEPYDIEVQCPRPGSARRDRRCPHHGSQASSTPYLATPTPLRPVGSTADLHRRSNPAGGLDCSVSCPIRSEGDPLTTGPIRPRPRNAVRPGDPGTQAHRLGERDGAYPSWCRGSRPAPVA